MALMQSSLNVRSKDNFHDEIWRPDTERCTRYRLTNASDSDCGRGMKLCPLNKLVTADGSLLKRIASWCGIHARWLKPPMVPLAVRLDDLGHKIDPAKQKMAYYTGDIMPVPNDLDSQPVDRKAAMAAAADLETPAKAARG